MSLTGADVLWAGMGALLTPAALHLLPIAAILGFGSAPGTSGRFLLTATVSLALAYAASLLLNDPLVASGSALPEVGVGLAVVACGVLQVRHLRGLSHLWFAPACGVACALLRVPLAGPRLLLLYGSTDELSMVRAIYHLGTGTALALVFLVAYGIGRQFSAAGLRRVCGAVWIGLGLITAVGGVTWFGDWLLRRWPISTLG